MAAGNTKPGPGEFALIERGVGGTLGITALDLATGERAAVRAEEPFPLASVFKVAVMVATLRAVDAGEVRLDERLALSESDKSPGGTLIHCHAGLRPTVRDLLYLMITLSDNTATDMVWRRLGLSAVNGAMRELGLSSIDCFMPNREFFLIEAGLGADWAGLDGPATVARWRRFQADGSLHDAYLRLLAEHQRLSGAEFQRRYDEAWGVDQRSGFERTVVIDQALDNRGSPGDIAALMEMIAVGTCASPQSCALMREILTRQEWRDRIPTGLPGGLRIGNKTGSVSGSINDSAIVFLPSGAPIVIVVLWKDLDEDGEQRAPQALGRIARLTYDRFMARRPPA